MPRVSSALPVFVLATLLAPTASAIPVLVTIDEIQTGRVTLTAEQLVASMVDEDALELDAPSPTCAATRRFFSSRICTQYAAGPPADTPEGRQALAVSDDDRYHTNPNGSGLSALRLDLSLAASIQTLRLDAEVAQASPDAPLIAYVFNHDSGRYDVVGMRAGRSDGLLQGFLDTVHIAGGNVTLILVNSASGRSGFYVDTVGFDDEGSVPEPSPALLTALGLAGLAAARRARAARA